MKLLIRMMFSLKPLLYTAVAAAVLIGCAPAEAAPIRVIDGDTIVFHGEKLRLEGIDAPELGQRCSDAAGKKWACGQETKARLAALTSLGKVTCSGNSHDAYGRRIATCFVSGRNINADLVRSGHALAFRRYSLRYDAEELDARLARRGVWSGNFEMPWDYRARRWQVARQQAPDGCPIKGNISVNGRIYHAPWSPHYSRTRINEAAGERWFCSEAEAIAAGWRAPR